MYLNPQRTLVKSLLKAPKRICAPWRFFDGRSRSRGWRHQGLCLGADIIIIIVIVIVIVIIIVIILIMVVEIIIIRATEEFRVQGL